MRSTLARSRVIHFIAGSFSLRLSAGSAPGAAVATGTLACVGVCHQPSRHSPSGNVIDGTLMYHTLCRNRHYHRVARIATSSVQKCLARVAHEPTCPSQKPEAIAILDLFLL